MGIIAIYPNKELGLSKGSKFHKKYPYLLRNLKIERPNQVWSTDWPMCKIDEHVELIKSLELSENIENGIFGDNSKNIYRLSL